MQSRGYQIELADEATESVRRKHKSVLVVLATGGGKTHIASMFLSRAIAKGKKAMFVANRRKLVHQCAGKLKSEGIPHGIIMAGEPLRSMAPVQVCSIDTLNSRYMQPQDKPVNGDLFAVNPLQTLPPADLIIFDEAHVSLSEIFVKLRKEYPNAIFLGFTATPCLANGKGLGAGYTDMVLGPAVGMLTEMGFLVPAEYYGADVPDFSGVKINKTGDFDEDQAAKVMDTEKLNGSIIENWLRCGEGRQTVVFASSVAHSIHIAEEFNKAGIKAAHVDADTSDFDRQTIFDGVHSGEIRIITNFGILVEGWDEPQVSCCVLAQKTRNPGRFLQMGGRVLRPVCNACKVSCDWHLAECPNCGSTDIKRNSIIIDHTGMTGQWYLDDDFGWSLDTDQTIQERQAAKSTDEKTEPKPRICPKCKYSFKRMKKCPKCGHQLKGKEGKPVEFVDMALLKLERKKKREEQQKIDNSPETKERWLRELTYIGRDKGYKEGWAAAKFKDKFGVWPRGIKSTPQMPSDDVKSYLRYQNIRRAKSFAAKAQEGATANG